jgi:UDP-N-acetylmuramate--alanine ligase
VIPSTRIKQLHFIGIGGAGMSGIAEVLHKNGFRITGSDQQESPVVKYLKNEGIEIFIGHDPKNIKNADIVVYSSAVRSDNPEMIAASEIGVPVIRRAEMLGELMRLKHTIAVAGTHGKTTTTSIAGNIWNTAAQDPTIIVGGIVKTMGTGARHGQGQILIAEADEYDRSFLAMVPTMAVITNIDEDHLDCYKDLEEIKSAFIQFANKVPFYGEVIVCIDDNNIQDILPEIRKPLVTYGFSKQSDYRIENYKAVGFASVFEVWRKGERFGEFKLNVPGKHNVLNATASIAVAAEEGLSIEDIHLGIESFTGVKRRFEYLGERNGAVVYDDYAHHPSETAATLAGVRENFPGKTVIVVFQPHLYSRTQDHYDSFGATFIDSDVLIVTEVYGARENPIEGVTGDLIVQSAKRKGHGSAFYAQNESQLNELLDQHVEKDAIVMFMGAGSIWRFAESWVAGGAN